MILDLAAEKARLQRELDLEIVRHYTYVSPEGTFPQAPGKSVAHLHKSDPKRIETENRELEEFVWSAYQTRFPKKVITFGHKAPFDFFSDLFFERVKNALGFANRNGGKTRGIAILNHLDLVFKVSCEIASAGAVLDQAEKCYRYFREFNESKWCEDLAERYFKATGRKFIVKSIQSWTEYGTGSTLEVITGSEKGMRSPHPHKARIDEIDLMEWSVLQTGLSMARSEGSIRGQNTFTSTRQLQNGPMQRLLDSAEAKGISVYEWNIWETVEKCPRRCFQDPEHGDCPIYVYCKGKAHHCEGFYSIDDFIDKVRLIDRDTFETEWENKKPAKHRLVYNNFDNTRHVMTPERLAKLTGYNHPSRFWTRIGGLDFGSAPGHPFVYLKLAQLPTGQFIVFHEYVAEQRLLRDHAAAIKSSPFWSPSEYIYSDWDAQDRLELLNHGVRTREAKKDVLTGIDYVRELLSGYPPHCDPQLYVWYECSNVISEFGAYSWPVTPDGKPDRTGNPKKEHDHCMDALRYALYSQKTSSRSKYRAYKSTI
jgi:hypothetical protein